MSSKTYEIRDPIHGFVVLSDWERDIVNHPVFQRLRRIRQLGWTDMVYPGAMHTRFEHSLGVMHVATRMFDEIVTRRHDFLKSELSFTDGGLEKDRTLVRLSALLHDLGHPPFSHAAEELMPRETPESKPYRHENYSAAAVQLLMRDVIENHPLNENYGLKARDIADFLNGRGSLGRCLLWRDLIASQLDADRADYLLRDSHHIGVAYGRYDLSRLLVTLTVAIDPDTDSPKLAVEEGGLHAAEALILARYLMFTQVYFQHTRRAYDHHLARTVQELLCNTETNATPGGNGTFPPPTDRGNVEQYLAWTDWRVLGAVEAGGGGEHGGILRARTHHRRVYETREIPHEEDLTFAERVRQALAEEVAFVDTAKDSFYKFDGADIPILRHPDTATERLESLSRLSAVVKGLRPVSQTRIYVPYGRREEARRIVEDLEREREALE